MEHNKELKRLATLLKIATNQVTKEIADPDVWAELELDSEAFCAALAEAGALVSINFTFTGLHPKGGALLDPLENGVCGGEPEFFEATITIEPTAG